MISTESELSKITAALAAKLETIPELRVFDYVPDTISPPAVLIQLPRTLRNPADRIANRLWRYVIPVSLILGRVSERDIRDKYDRYVPQIERALPGADVCHAHIGERAQARQVSYGGIDVIQVDVMVEVWGS